MKPNGSLGLDRLSYLTIGHRRRHRANLGNIAEISIFRLRLLRVDTEHEGFAAGLQSIQNWTAKLRTAAIINGEKYPIRITNSTPR